ncbi:hypothetical protein ACK1X7_43620 [Streptomyces sp. CY1]
MSIPVMGAHGFVSGAAGACPASAGAADGAGRSSPEAWCAD